MLDVEPVIREELERLSAQEKRAGNWDDVVHRSRQGSSDSPPRWRPRLVAAVVLVVGLAVGAALVPGRFVGHNTSFVDRALAAVSHQPVLHAVLEIPADKFWAGGSASARFRIVNLRTGATRPVMARSEIWFDSQRQLLRRIDSNQGAVEWSFLQTRNRTVDARGRTNASEPPRVEPALTTFLTGYRAALASGKAHDVGPGVVHGRKVEWLRFPSGTAGVYDTVAVDRKTFKPIALHLGIGHSAETRDWTISTIESLPRTPGIFSMPPVKKPRTNGRYSNAERRLIPVRDASALLRRRAVWAAPGTLPLPFSGVYFENYSRHSSLPVTKRNVVGRGLGLMFLYGATIQRNGGWRVPPGAPYVGIVETTSFRFGPGNLSNSGGDQPLTVARAPLPPVGQLALSTFDADNCIGQLRRGALLVEIDGSSCDLVLRTARHLMPTP
jgi:hypothetical protein